MKSYAYLFLSLALILPALADTESAGSKNKASGNPLFPATILNNEGKEVDASVLGNKIVGIYFSAKWCPPCRGFTPTLVEFRDQNSKDFEVVFVSSDRSQEDQLKYMKEYGMKWYTLPHRSDAANALAEKFQVRGIPSLVIVDAKGKTVSKNGRSEVSQNPKGALAGWRKNS